MYKVHFVKGTIKDTLPLRGEMKQKRWHLWTIFIAQPRGKMKQKTWHLRTSRGPPGGHTPTIISNRRGKRIFLETIDQEINMPQVWFSFAGSRCKLIPNLLLAISPWGAVYEHGIFILGHEVMMICLFDNFEEFSFEDQSLVMPNSWGWFSMSLKHSLDILFPPK